MTNIIPLKIPAPCLQCDDCEQTVFWFALDGQIACATCQAYLDGVKWEFVDETQTAQ